MNRSRVAILIAAVVLVAFPVANFFYQSDLVSFFAGIGWHKMVSLVSGPWWDSLGTFALVVGLIFTLEQIYEARKGTNAQIATHLFEHLRDATTKCTMQTLYGQDSHTLANVLNPPNRELSKRVSDVLDWYDLLGALVERGIIDAELAIEGFAGRSTLRSWFQLAPYIRTQQRQRGTYAENYEAFAYRCWRYFAKRGIVITLQSNNYRIDDIVATYSAVRAQQNFGFKHLLPRSRKRIRRDRRRRPTASQHVH